MKFIPENIYHVYNQGNNQQQIFLRDADYQLFLNYTKKLLLPHCDIIAYCLMPNHFHFLLKANTSCEKLFKQGGLLLDPLTNGFRKLLSGYARIFNLQYGRTGSLFRQKTKVKCLNEIIDLDILNIYSSQDYYSTCFYYIHYNPVHAGLVLHEKDWKWSSYRYYGDLEHVSICNKDLAREFCGYQERDFMNAPRKLDKSIITTFEV